MTRYIDDDGCGETVDADTEDTITAEDNDGLRARRHKEKPRTDYKPLESKPDAKDHSSDRRSYQTNVDR